MHHSTVEPWTLATPADADGFFFDLGSFYEQAELLSDPREPRGKRGTRHPDLRRQRLDGPVR